MASKVKTGPAANGTGLEFVSRRGARDNFRNSAAPHNLQVPSLGIGPVTFRKVTAHRSAFEGTARTLLPTGGGAISHANFPIPKRAHPPAPVRSHLWAEK